ncbi:MAG: ABC transporter substrate-binding protein, partial [Planctomycetota bacterium]
RYCDYPPEALARAKVGGYYDPNYEAIVDLKPDLVVTLTEHVKVRKDLTGLGIETLSVSNKIIPDIQNAIVTIGARCGAENRAGAIVSDIKGRLARIEERTRRLPRPRVMISVGRNMGSGSLEDVYIAGRGTFYDEMIALAGGENAYQGSIVKYAALSAEGILELDPDVIIDLVADLERQGLEKEAVLRDWRTVAGAAAVKAGRVRVLSQDYVVIPGPRFVLLVEDLARIIHPEIDWD